MPAPPARKERAPRPTVGDIPRLIAAMDRFVAAHSGFESSTVGEVVLEEMSAAADLCQAALAPLRHKVFGFVSALKWGFFLSNAAPRILAEESLGRSVAGVARFDLLRFNAELVTIYDMAVESAVWAFCEDDDEDVEDVEDEEDEEDEYSGSGSDADAATGSGAGREAGEVL